MATNNAVNVNLSGQSGTGSFAGTVSPTFTTPNIGAASGTSFNSLTAAATQAEQEAGSSVTAVTTPGRQQFHPSAAKAWALYNTVTSTAIVVSYNVTSLTDNGTGDTTVNFTVAFSTANYSYVGMGNNGLAHATIVEQDLGVTAPAAGSCRMITTRMSTDGAEDMNGASVAYYGDQ